MTNATSGVRLGGGGYSYGDYSLPNSKKPAPLDDEEGSSGSRQEVAPRKSKEKEIEVFLFTIKDPVKSVISKLMDLIATYGPEAIVPIDIKLAETGPLGYTSLFAFQPTLGMSKQDNLIKPVIK
jgi:hypothetical protein